MDLGILRCTTFVKFLKVKYTHETIQATAPYAQNLEPVRPLQAKRPGLHFLLRLILPGRVNTKTEENRERVLNSFSLSPVDLKDYGEIECEEIDGK